MVVNSVGSLPRTLSSAHTVDHDKVVLECLGYRRSNRVECLPFWAATALYHATVWTLKWTLPSLAQWLLARCPVSQAEYVLVKLIDGRQRLVRVEILVSSAGWLRTHEEEAAAGESFDDHKYPVFRLFLRLYYYSSVHNTFVAVPAMPWVIPGKIRDALACLRSINQGGTWRAFNASHRRYRENIVQLFGTHSQPAAFQELVLASLSRVIPTIIAIQYVELLYLTITGYWIFSLLIGLLSAAANTAFLVHLWKKYITMVQLVQQQRVVPVVHSGWVRAMVSRQLVPGDVVVLTRGKVSCDMVLLRGSCLAEESMLSGETKQVRKSSYRPEGGIDYEPDMYHTCTVFAGTVVQQVWNTDDPEDEPLAMVVRTGYNTTVGAMARQLLAPTRLPQIDPFVEDCLRLYAYGLVCQLFLLTAYLTCFQRLHRHTAAGDVVKRCFEVILHAAPPGVPAVLMFSGGSKRGALQAQGTTMHAPDLLKAVGETTLVAFDKTGTLTGSAAIYMQKQMQGKQHSGRLVDQENKQEAKMRGVLSVQGGVFGPLQSGANTWSNMLTQAAAACNGLIMVNKSTVVGDELETALFKAVEARFLDRETVVLPRKPNGVSPLRLAKLRMLRVLEFNSQTLKSGVVVESNDAPEGCALLFVRGAPNVVKDLVRPASVPKDFNQVRDEYSSNSFRLMALAVGILKDVDKLDLASMSQPEIEAHALPLQLLGLIVLSNQIRPESRDTITQLQEGAGIRTLMITGDYQHTAIAVAKDVGMGDSSKPLLLIEAKRAHLQRQLPLPSSVRLGAQPLLMQHNAFQSGLYASTGTLPSEKTDTPGVSLVNDPGSAANEGQAADPGSVNYAALQPVMSLEESAAIQHTVSLELHPSLYCVRPIKPTYRLQPLQTVPPHTTHMPADQSHGHPHGPVQPADQLKAPAQGGCSPTHHPQRYADDGVTLRPAGQPDQQSAQRPQQTLFPALSSATDALGLGMSEEESAALQHGPGRGLSLSKRHVSFGPNSTSAAGPDQCPEDSTLLQQHGSLQQAAINAHLATAGPYPATADPHPATAGLRLLKPVSILRRDPPAGAGLSQIPQLIPPEPPPAPLWLSMVDVSSGRELAMSEALLALAEGSLHCAITGDGFEQLLHHSDVSVLELVMRTAVVFARMKPHQKGQVMDLLGRRGIYQMFQGKPRHLQGLENTCVFCGDGINDLAALSAADVGMAIGATDANVAAAITTSKPSVAGVVGVIKAGKSHGALISALLKFMIVYQFVLSCAETVAYCLDGSKFSDLQRGVFDIQAMTLALAAATVPPVPGMTHQRLDHRISSRDALTLLMTMFVGCAVAQASHVVLLRSQAWYHGGTGTSEHNPVNTMMFEVGLAQVLAPVVSFTIECKRFCQHPLQHKPTLFMYFFYIVPINVVIMAGPGSSKHAIFHALKIYKFPADFRYHMELLLVCTAAVYAVAVHVARRILNAKQEHRIRPI